MGMNQSIGKRYPTKTNINLAMKDSRKREYRKLFLAAAALAIFIAAFTKFAVVDRLAAASEAEYAAARVKSQLEAVESANRNFDEVREAYEDYNLNQSLVSGKTDALDILDLIEKELLSTAMVESFSSANGVITVKIAGVTLNQISTIFKNLTLNPLVAHVQVFTASATEEDKEALTTAAMTISLKIESESGSEGADSKTEGGDGS